jgi:uncharacterized protein
MTRKKHQQLDAAFLDALVMRNKPEIQRLLKLGANVDAKDVEHQQPAIMLATMFCDRDILESLINEGARVDARDDQGRTALFLADVNSEIFATLLSSGADITAVDHDGNSILMRKVSESASVDVVEKLLSLGVDPSLRNNDGESALELATELGLVNVIERLRSYESV